MEEPPGFEPGIAALQAAALPLGDGSIFNRPLNEQSPLTYVNAKFSSAESSRN